MGKLKEVTANMRRSENEREEKRDDNIIHMTIVEEYNSGRTI